MSYEVLALKWRPQKFSELIGQKTVQTTLTNALKNKRLHPVCLFTGPRGTGKTSTARILAKTMRCQYKKDPFSPCGECEECQLIQKGKSIDVMEIDGASNNGVEAVRELRDTLSYMPSSGSKKIYIIDEVHMLSTSAFNALLKTLEEPPSHVLFIMATTEAQKIPLTVVSRCQKFDFHLIPHRLIKSQLEKICKGEGISIDGKSLWLIAKQAQGSLRDGQSLLDQMATFCDGSITFKKVIDTLGLADPMLLSKTLDALCKRDEKQIVCIINEQRNTGLDSKLFLQNLVEGLRDLLILKKNPENKPPLVNRSHEEIEELKICSSQVSYEDLHFLFDLALKGEKDQAVCHDSQLALEVLLLKLSQAPRLESLVPFNPFLEEDPAVSKSSLASASLKKQRSLEKSSANCSSKEKNPFFKNGTKNPLSSSVTVSLNEKEGAVSHVKSLSKNIKEENDMISVRQPPFSFISFADSKTSLKEMEKVWIQFIKFLKLHNPSLAGAVANLSLKGFSENSFVFYEPSFEYIKEKIVQPESFRFLLEQLNLFLKSSGQFTIQFQHSNEADQPIATLEKLSQRQDNEDLFKEACADTFIQKLNQVFEGNIKSVNRLHS